MAAKVKHAAEAGRIPGVGGGGRGGLALARFHPAIHSISYGATGASAASVIPARNCAERGFAKSREARGEGCRGGAV